MTDKVNQKCLLLQKKLLTISDTFCAGGGTTKRCPAKRPLVLYSWTPPPSNTPFEPNTPTGIHAERVECRFTEHLFLHILNKHEVLGKPIWLGAFPWILAGSGGSAGGRANRRGKTALPRRLPGRLRLPPGKPNQA